MLLGYGYFLSPILKGAGLTAAWVAYNKRCDDDTANTPEPAVNVCLFQRYDLIISR